MNRRIILIILSFGFLKYCSAQWGTVNTTSIYNTNTGNVGIGTGSTTAPSVLFEVKRGIDFGTTGSQFVSPLYIGTCNDFGGGGADQFLLLTPYFTGSSGTPSAGLSGTLTFYRGNTGGFNLNEEYDVNIQTAYGSSNVDLMPRNSVTAIENIYTVDYSGSKYIAIDVDEFSNSAMSINFKGFYWNNINTTKPTLVLATSVTNATILKTSASIAGNIMHGTVAGNIGIGTITPNSKLEVAGKIISSGASGASGVIEARNVQNGNAYFTTNTSSGNGYANLNASDGTPKVSLTSAGTSYFSGGNLLIGKTSQINNSYLLDVAGNVRANKLVVNSDGADYVFDSTYKLSSLHAIENYIHNNHHLPDIPAAIKMQNEGVDLGENQIKLLAKIEELTLYIIDQNKNIEQLQKEVEKLKATIYNSEKTN